MIRRIALAFCVVAGVASAQMAELSQGGPIEVTAQNGFEWRQHELLMIARGAARAVRGGVTIDADLLLARYRPRGGAPAETRPPSEGPGGASELWRLEAEGNVVITTATDRGEADHAVYELDEPVMVLTGRNLRLTSPDNVLTAQDSVEYWPQRRMAVARGDAVVVTKDDKRVRADVLVAYFKEAPTEASGAPRPQPARSAGEAAPGQGSNLEKVEAYGRVEIRTAEEVIRGDSGVSPPPHGLARLLGNVRIVRGDNVLTGCEAIVTMDTGISRLVACPNV
ncbi:MAG: LptA/OstA family protein, partial [Alphaproteobacteria bacterium]